MLTNGYQEAMQMAKKPESPKKSRADELVKTPKASKKGEVQLTEDQLNRVAGGIDGESTHRGH
jgi:hypothetical protein